jgi:hypothetical protein
MGSRNKLKAVEEYGRRYVREYLAEARNQRDAIAGDPLAALMFMHGKLFMRGRRDEISVAFRDRTREVLERYGSLEEIDLRVLEEELVGNRVNNRYDRRMVRESVGFARDELMEHDRNVFTWAVDAIRRGEVVSAYNALQGIFAVADKLATFYLRDVTLVEGIEDCIMQKDYPYVQPVDTWVEQVAGSLGLIDDSDRRKRSAIKRKIISSCLEAEVSPLLFNAGAWMVGAHAYRLLFELL